MQETWAILWAILGVFLVAAEVFTTGFVLLWFGVAALLAALVAYLGFGLPLQFLVFVIAAVALTAMSRTLFVNYFSKAHKTGDELKTGVDSLPGKIGLVVKDVDDVHEASEVKVFGSTWTALLEAGDKPLQAGERVEIVRVTGATLFVRRVGGLPEWRGKSEE